MKVFDIKPHQTLKKDIGVAKFAALDVFKMLAASALCGIVFSLFAVCLTLLLMNNADAHDLHIEKHSSLTRVLIQNVSQSAWVVEASPDAEVVPGQLYVGDGCGREPLEAIDGDWLIRIHSDFVDVSVKQTFLLPIDGSTVANFHVQLPRGARLRGLAALTQNKDWAGQLISDEQYDRLTPTAYLKLTHDRLLVSHSTNGSVMTSPILNLRTDEVVTIQYTYEIAPGGDNGRPSFKLPLAPTDHSEGGIPASTTEVIVSKLPTTKGAVWVEWIGRKPMQVMGLHVDEDMEISKTSVEGFSWTVNGLLPGATLHLGWSLSEI